MGDAYAGAILEHYQKAWGRVFETKRWHKGPVGQLPQAFTIIEVPPHGGRNMWVYATCCMSQLEDSRKREVLLYSPNASEQNIELLTVVAHYHRTGSELDYHHSVNFGRPWLPGSSCSYGLLSWPYLEPAEFSSCSSPKGDEISFIWLLPITEAERTFKKTAGVDALEEAFENAHLNYLDPFRASVV